jgi:hypothetical protein
MSGRDKAPPRGPADKFPSPPPEEPAHDVLAAEEFAMPAPDPYLRHQPITLPDDPTGIAEPHDVLAAEEFAMPATRPPSPSTGAVGRIAEKAGTPERIAVLAAVALGVLRGLARRRRA